jgi:threonine/homoserine/homoserine lactone efflux protein
MCIVCPMAILAVLGLFASSFVVALSGAVMPGPVFTAVVSESARRGPSAGPLFMGGHAILELALVALIALGLGSFLAARQVFIATSLLGGAIMLVMAISMFVSLPKLRLETADRGKRYARILLSGAALSLSNPYWTVWWISIGLGWITRSLEFGPAGVAAFYLGHIGGDLAWYSFVSFMVSRGRRFLTDGRYRVLIGACAAALALFGAQFIWAGASSLLKPA